MTPELWKILRLLGGSMKITICEKGRAECGLKRTLGESLKARKYRYQAKEIKIKLILYNIRKTITSVRSLLRIELFYKAVIPTRVGKSRPTLTFWRGLIWNTTNTALF